MQTFRISRRSAALVALVFASSAYAPPIFAQQGPEEAIVGKWEADDGTVKLDMFRAGSEFRARLLYGNEVVEADNVTFKQDAKNPDPSLRSRSLKNIVFIWGLHWRDGEWSGGSLYDGSSGRTYGCDISLKGGKMNLRGYLGILALGQTRLFHRI